MIAITLIWLKISKKKIVGVSDDNAKNFIVIIPVLREQKILRKTVEYFLSARYNMDKVTILLVSTEKEVKEVSNVKGEIIV